MDQAHYGLIEHLIVIVADAQLQHCHFPLLTHRTVSKSFRVPILLGLTMLVILLLLISEHILQIHWIKKIVRAGALGMRTG